MMQSLITIENLGFNYGEGWVFHSLNLAIEAGDFVAVVGANGAGKSTLLKLLARVLTPSQGQIYFYGQPLASFQGWEQVGYVPQNPARQQKGFPISVAEVVALGLLGPGRCSGLLQQGERARIEACLAQFGLSQLAGRRLGELSGGQQQRVFLARAMVKEPSILLLDEPASGIDSQAKAGLYRLLQQLNRKGVTIVMVSHDLDLAAQSAQHALCLDHGICFWGPAALALTHQHRHGTIL